MIIKARGGGGGGGGRGSVGGGCRLQKRMIHRAAIF